MVSEEVFVNCYNFNPIFKVPGKKCNFQGILKNYPEPEPKEIIRSTTLAARYFIA
jgi:hypothetical protein